MDGEPITSASNALLKRARKLRQRKYREQEGAFFVEGLAPVLQAIEHDADVETLIVAPELLTSERAKALIEPARRGGMATALVSADAFATVSERENPSGLAAVVRSRAVSLEDLDVPGDALFVALHEAGNPGNVGTIVRTVDAVGGDGVILVGDTTDSWHPSSVKASMGTIFSTALATAETVDEVFEWATRHDLAVVTTSARAPHDYWAVDYPERSVVLFGSEGTGLPAGILERGDVSVRIPMRGSASSLNLAVSAGVVLYELARRRSGHGT